MRPLAPLAALLLAAAVPAEAGGFSLWPRRGWDGGEDGFRIAATSFVQLDVRALPGWSAERDHLPDLEPSFEVQRLRFGFGGGYGKRIAFSAAFDAISDDERLRNGWVDYRFAPELTWRIGYFKLPISPDFLTGIRINDFTERSRAAVLLGPGRDLGTMLSGTVGRWQYQAAVTLGDGLQRTQRAETTLSGRLVFSPVPGLDVGGAATRGDVRADVDNHGDAFEGEPGAKGVAGRTQMNHTFLPRPFVSGARTRLALEANWQQGPLTLRAEGLWSTEEREGQACALPACGDLPSVRGTSFFVTGLWTLRGERKGRQLTIDDGAEGLGALEIGARVEAVFFDDTGNSGVPETRGTRAANSSSQTPPARDSIEVAFASSNFVPQGLWVATAGVSWWPSPWSRVTGNVITEWFTDPASAPEPGRGGPYVTLVARLQLHLP